MAILYTYCHMYMHNWDMGGFISSPLWVAPFAGLVLVAALWSLVWKGLGLWHAGRRGDQWWFIAILVVNSLGILEIIYLFGIAKLRFDQLFTKGNSHTHNHHHDGGHDHNHSH